MSICGNPILVVDDEPLVALWLEDTLSKCGYGVVVAHDAIEALELIEGTDNPFSVLLTDIDLGRGLPTGWDVADRARRLDPGFPIIYMTGKSAADWATRGVVGSILLSKPFCIDEVVEAIATIKDRQVEASGASVAVGADVAA